MMNSRVITYIVCGLLFGAIVAGIIYYLITHKNVSVNQSGQEISELPSPTPLPVINKTYSSDAGFSFEYPSSVTINENTDSTSYANLSITSKEIGGSITFQVTDSKLKSTDAYFTSQKIKTTDAEEIPFGDIEAAEIATDGGILTVSLDQGALFIVRTNWNDSQEFWQKVHDMILSTFEFAVTEDVPVAPSNQSAGGDASGDDIIFEGEEIVE